MTRTWRYGPSAGCRLTICIADPRQSFRDAVTPNLLLLIKQVEEWSLSFVPKARRTFQCNARID